MAERGILALVNPERLRRILTKMLDENEFLGPHGIRSISKFHEQHPYVFHVNGQEYRVDYLPAESNTGMFGGNSNWRGPVWMPVNALIIRALQNFYLYYGDNFKIECPTGSGRMMNLFEVSKEISDRLISTFTRDEQGRRPVYGGSEKFQTDPHWRDYILFYEYFHGDNGAGLGASHQTGWTGLVAKLIELYGLLDPKRALEVGKKAAFEKRREAREQTMKAWPRHPVIYEVNTWVWLNDLSRKHQRRVDLATVPEQEWDAIAAQGFDAVWFMGVWERSPAGIGISMRNEGLLQDFRRALPDFSPQDNVGSPYCVRRYVVDEHLGGPKGLAAARRHLGQRGLRLILDFVPNHVAPDHPWVGDHPEYFIQGSADDARSDPASFIERGGKVFACGRDPYFPAWPDVLQLNAFQPGAPAGGDRDDLGDRRTVRRRPLRHGHAPAERHLRAHLGRPRGIQTRRRLLDDGDPGDQGQASGVQVHRRGVLGSGVGAAAAGLRLLLRQETLRPDGARACRERAAAPPGGSCLPGGHGPVHREP